jgi:hypothetical protein
MILKTDFIFKLKLFYENNSLEGQQREIFLLEFFFMDQLFILYSPNYEAKRISTFVSYYSQSY